MLQGVLHIDLLSKKKRKMVTVRLSIVGRGVNTNISADGIQELRGRLRTRAIPGWLKSESLALDMALMPDRRKVMFWLARQKAERISGLVRKNGMMRFGREKMALPLRNKRSC